jgi:hypothetical protein
MLFQITHGDTVGGPEAYLAMEFTPVFIAYAVLPTFCFLADHLRSMQTVFTSINGVTDLIMVSLLLHISCEDADAARADVPRLADLGPKLLDHRPAAVLDLRRFQYASRTPSLRAHRSHACAVSAIISIYHQALLKPGQTFADVPIVVTSADALFVFALITNFTTTALIAGRIFYLFRVRMRGLHATHTQRYVNIVGMIVESGAHAAT